MTDKYLNGIPADSRAANKEGFLKITDVTHEKVEAARMLNDIAASRGQTLAQMAVAWLLADRRVTSVIIGASSVRQLESNLAAIDSPEFTSGQLDEICRIIEPSLL